MQLFPLRMLDVSESSTKLRCAGAIMLLCSLTLVLWDANDASFRYALHYFTGFWTKVSEHGAGVACEAWFTEFTEGGLRARLWMLCILGVSFTVCTSLLCVNLWKLRTALSGVQWSCAVVVCAAPLVLWIFNESLEWAFVERRVRRLMPRYIDLVERLSRMESEGARVQVPYWGTVVRGEGRFRGLYIVPESNCWSREETVLNVHRTRSSTSLVLRSGMYLQFRRDDEPATLPFTEREWRARAIEDGVFLIRMD